MKNPSHVIRLSVWG